MNRIVDQKKSNPKAANLTGWCLLYKVEWMTLSTDNNLSLVDLARIELVTSSLRTRRSPNWATGPLLIYLIAITNVFQGLLITIKANFKTIFVNGVIVIHVVGIVAIINFFWDIKIFDDVFAINFSAIPRF